MKILHIDTSIRKDRSVSRELTKHTVTLFRENPNVTVDYLDLNENTPAHINQEFLDAHRTPADGLRMAQHELLSESISLIERLRHTDLYIIGLPMYNFSFPSSFKTFLDNIMISGKTFKNDESGETGLLKDKKAIIISSRGATYDSPDTSDYDCLSPLVKTAFGYIGIYDVTMLKVEATVFFGEERKKQSIDLARKEIQTLADNLKTGQK